MFWYRMGGKHAPRRGLSYSPDKVVVRTEAGVRPDGMDEVVAAEGMPELRAMPAYGVPFANVAVYQTRGEGEPRAARDRARRRLRRSDGVRFAGRPLEDVDSGETVLYTENLFVEFEEDVDDEAARAVLAGAGLEVKRGPETFGAAAYVASADGRGTEVFDVANALLERDDVRSAHPELIFPRESRHGTQLHGWHLGPVADGNVRPDIHSFVASAWATGRGEGATIAVIDDGFDLNHRAFATRSRIVAALNVMSRDGDVAPPSPDDAHGTAVAGVACSEDERAIGVAPASRLIPIRLGAGLGSYLEADAIFWAVGSGADVIVCCWGRPDGHGAVALPDYTRMAIDNAVRNGRNGRGCTVVWAAGNGNESMDDDGYASHPDVIAVGASNAEGRRSAYSNFGTSLWCLFPSSDGARPAIPAPRPGDDVVPDFGGTSAAAAGVAGVCALMLEANGALTSAEVRDLLRYTATPIDAEGGDYDASGHSVRYGYGLIHAEAAVRTAREARTNIAALGNALRDGLQTEAIVVNVEPTANRDAVMRAIRDAIPTVAPGTWSVESVARHPTSIDVVPAPDLVVPSTMAWDLTHASTQIAGVAAAQPTFDRVVLDVPRVPRAAIGFCDHDPRTELDGDGCEWHVTAVRAREAWAHSETVPSAVARGQGIRIAHPDSGYRVHPRLDPARIDVASAFDFIDGDPDPIDDRDGNHGLATASILLGDDTVEQGTPYVVGVAPRATLVPLRVVKRTIWSWTVPILVEVGMRRLRDAIDHAIETDCHVVSISLGGTGGDTSALLAIQDAVERGIIVLAAAGNVIPIVVRPAAFPEVIAVASCDVHQAPWRHSARGPEVDITAPGVSIWRAFVDDDAAAPAVARSCGTSYAVALVAGAAALWLAHHGREQLLAAYGPRGMVEAFRQALKDTATPLPNVTPGRYGAGLLNVEALLAAPGPAPGPAPVRARSLRPTEHDPMAELARVFPTTSPARLRAGVRDLLGQDDVDGALERVGHELVFAMAARPALAAAFADGLDVPDRRRSTLRTRERAVHSVRQHLRMGGPSERLQGLLE